MYNTDEKETTGCYILLHIFHTDYWVYRIVRLIAVQHWYRNVNNLVGGLVPDGFMPGVCRFSVVRLLVSVSLQFPTIFHISVAVNLQ